MADQMTRNRFELGIQPDDLDRTTVPPLAKPPATQGTLKPMVNPIPATGAPAQTPVPATQTATPTAPLTPVPATPPQGQPPGVGLTPTDPNNPLTTQTIARNPIFDRFKLAEDRFNTFTQSTNPAYQAALRDANRAGAAAGRLGSGQLRTSLGDLANQRNLQLQTAGQGFLQDALSGSMEDVYRDLGIAQQQQGFQAGQQQQAFENELRRLGFTEDMLNSAFGRGLQQWMAGQQGGTGAASTQYAGSQVGQSGTDALNALYGLIRGQAATPAPAPTPTPTQVPWLGGING